MSRRNMRRGLVLGLACSLILVSGCGGTGETSGNERGGRETSVYIYG